MRTVALFLLFSSSFAASAHWLPAWKPRGDHTRIRYSPEFEIPSDPSSFFAVSQTHELSQSVLYHGTGESIDNAKQADILFFGNSRMPAGLREEFVLPAAAALDLRVFSLGCGYGEGGGFLLELLQKHDLRPKILVMVGGPLGFRSTMSPIARQAIEMTKWEARQLFFETTAMWELRTRLHRRLPKIDPFTETFHRHWVIYRSARTGWWQPVLEPPSTYEVRYREEMDSYPRSLAFATELKAELDRRGTLLVVTTVPWNSTRIGHLEEIETTLGVPAIPPIPDDRVTVNDGSHLSRAGAKIITQSFWQRFIERPEVRARLDLEGR